MRGKKGALHPRFRTGRLKSRDGYWRVLAGNHPFQRRYHYIFEHVMKMERKIGRRLLPTECVHHKNGNPGDNRISNLRLMTKSEHSKLHRRLDAGARSLRRRRSDGTWA